MPCHFWILINLCQYEFIVCSFTAIFILKLNMALEVCNVFKQYGDGNQVLKGINLKVSAGKITALLGSSGCGKTTLLSIITGLIKPDSGTIKVLGKTVGCSNIPGKLIGIMPQESCLHEYLTIGEMIAFYANLYCLDEQVYMPRLCKLLVVLDLPSSTTFISKLSGGERRRTSLALALIHQPSLLLLDEPLVNLDSVRRENIWMYLKQLSKCENVAILITTHYYAETKNCDQICYMRSGKILKSGSPSKFLQTSNDLQTAIIELCKADEDSNNTNYQIPENVSGILQCPAKCESLEFSWQILKALIFRNFKFQIRRYTILIIQLMLPIFQTLLVTQILGTSPKGLQLSLVAPDVNVSINCTGKNVCFDGPEFIMCKFLEAFNNNPGIILNHYSDLQEAVSSLSQGHSLGYINIGSNFSSNFANRMIEGNFASNQTIEGSTISVELDYSNYLLASFTTKSLVDSYFEFIKSVLISCDIDTRIADVPLKINPMYGIKESNWENYFIPSLIIDLAFVLAAAVTAEFLVDDNYKGTLNRCRAAGVKFLWITIATLISQFIFLLPTNFVLFTFIHFAFPGFIVNGSWIIIICLSLCTGILGICLGILLGTCCRNIVELSLLLTLIIHTSFNCTGAFWPLQTIWPSQYQLLCNFYPITIPMEGMRSLFLRGWGLMHLKIWTSFAATLVWSSVFLAISCWLYK